MANQINVGEYLELLEKSKLEKKITNKTENQEFSDNFTLTRVTINNSGLDENQLLPSLSFVNMSGSITFKDIDCLNSLRFSNNDNLPKRKKLKIVLENVELKEIALFNLKSNDVEISFKNVIAEKTEITRSIINSEKFHISDSVINELAIVETEFVYEDTRKNDSAILLRNSVMGSVLFNNVKTISEKLTEGKVLVENCFITKDLKIKLSPQLGNLLLSKTTLNLDPWWQNQQSVAYDSLNTNLGTIQKLELAETSLTELKIANCNLKELIARESTLVTLAVTKASTLGRFSYSGFPPAEGKRANIDTLHIDNATVEVLNIDGTEQKYAAIDKLKLTNASIKKGVIKGTRMTGIYMEDLLSSESFLQINDTVAKRVSFKNFNNLGLMHLINLRKVDEAEPNPVLELKNSTLGKIHFYGCEFNKRILYANSSITDITVLSTTLPWQFKIGKHGSTFWRLIRSVKKIPLVLKLRKQKTSSYSQQLSLLGQLRRVYEQNNDVSNAMNYNARQLDMMRKQRSLGWERFALWLNYATNFYGNNLRQAFWVTFSGCILFYFLYGVARGYIVIFEPYNEEYALYMLSNFLEFISPVRRINLLKPVCEYANNKWNPATEDIDGLTVFVSGASRLVVSYLLVQFILAFRKYGRKA